MTRIQSGVFGLDELLYGGFVKNTVNALIGTTGCGKTIFSIQYLLEGLEAGERGVYVSIDLTEEEFIRIAESMGWDLEKYVRTGQLKIGQFYVKDASFLDSDLIKFVRGKDLRIVIDSFSPLIASADYSSRSSVGFFFKTLREYGTALVTLEEPFIGEPSALSNISLFLADSVIQLKNVGYGELYSRTLRIVKHRMSKHADGVYPYMIIEGAGIIIEEKRCEGFTPELDDLPLSNIAKHEITKMAEKGFLTHQDIEKIKRRVI